MNRIFGLTLTVLLAVTCAVGAAERGPVRVAVLAGEGERAPKTGMVELLLVNLSKEKGVVLLERDEVRHLLAEQGISAAGLVESGTAVKAGRLLAVDLFAVVERSPDKDGPALLRMQAIEARTGILLDSSFVEEADATTAAPALAAAVLAAADRSRVPAGECRYVCLLGVQSEEPGRALDGFAQALQFLLAHDLSRARRVRLLDRERLDHLAAERPLSGIELELKASALLVECGVRRVAGKDALAFRGEVRPVAGGQKRAFDGEVTGQDVVSVRRALAARILAALDVEDGAAVPGDPAKEAAALLIRTRHLIAHEAGIEAARLAEAAYALAPSQESRLWLAKAWKDYAYGLRAKAPSTEDKERILTAQIRERSITLEMFREHARLQAQGRADKAWLPLVGGVLLTKVTAAPNERHIAELLREFALLDREIAYFKIDYYTKLGERNPASRALSGALCDAIRNAPRWATSATDWAAEMKPLLKRFAQPVGGDELPCRRTGQFVLIRILPGLERFRGTGESATVDGLWQWMTEQDDPLLALAGFANKVEWQKATTPETAREAWAYFREKLPLNHPDRQCNFDNEVAPLMGVILEGEMPKGDERAAWYLAIMGPVLESGEGQRVYQWLSALPHWDREIPRVLPPAEWRAWLEKALAVYRSDPYLNAPGGPGIPKGDKRSYAGGGGMEATLEAALAAAGAKPAAVPGLWSRFQVQPLTCEPPPGGAWSLDWIGPTPDGWLTVWVGHKDKGDARTLVATAHGRSGGPGKTLGRVTLPPTRDYPRFVTAVVQAHDRVYIGCYAGLVVCANGQADLRDASRGLPATRVRAVAALGDRVYVSVVHESEMRGGTRVGTGVAGAALCSLDPVSGTVVTLASSRSLGRRNPLDGEFLYSIESMLGDEKRGCVWLGVRTHSGAPTDAVGLWRFVPADGKIEQVVKTRSFEITDLVSSGKRIVARTGILGIRCMDPDTGAMEYLTDAHDSPYGSYLLGIGSFAFLGESLLAVSTGRLSLLEPGQKPIVMSSLPTGEALPGVAAVRQVDEDRVLVCAGSDNGASLGPLWIVEKKPESRRPEAAARTPKDGGG